MWDMWDNSCTRLGGRPLGAATTFPIKDVSIGSRTFHSYGDALDYLYSFINWEVERHMRYTPEVMTLERPRALLKALGNPQDRYPIIHITGTKGKGSVGAMCAAALQASGLRAALYSSPHLQDFRERFRVDNALITPDEFVAMINRMRPVLETMPDDITWFEVTTALAFLYFAEREVDIAVIEVGLGGGWTRPMSSRRSSR